MSRMFDSMRKAEEERRKRAIGQVVSESAGGAADRRIEGVVLPTAPTVPAGVRGDMLRELGMLRNGIEIALAGKKKKTILFTSAMHGEGTTSVAASYARILALEGRERVLVCEMNARRPAFSSVFSTNGDAGITEYFLSGMNLSELVQEVRADGLDVLHVGRRDATVIQIHLNSVFPRLMEEALRAYDTVIIDAPPVISSPETPPMTSFVDGVVMIVHAGKTKREVVLRALNSIANFKGHVLGIVLNRKRYFIPEFIYRRI